MHILTGLADRNIEFQRFAQCELRQEERLIHRDEVGIGTVRQLKGRRSVFGGVTKGTDHYRIFATVHSEIFSQTLFDFKRMVSHSISPKFSGKIPYVLSKPRI